MKARQRPTFERVPSIKASDGDMAAKLAEAYFGEPLPWQKYVLDGMLARNDDDEYVSHSYAVAVPRQNGKSWDVRARVFYGIVTTGEKVLYTCQHGDTADEMFRDLALPFEDEEEEELHSLLKAVRKTNGQQAIYLENGGYVRFTTRTNSLARGRSYDVIIYDEAQDLTRGQQAASLPTISASQTHNTQVIYLGTPPGPECVGDVFQAMHDVAHQPEDPPFAWLEWSVPEIGDIKDRKRWYETNPSLGVLITETAIEGELTMAPDDFARERLGWWTPARTAQTVIPRALWKQTEIKAIGNLYKSKTVLAVRFSNDGSSYALAGAKSNAKGEAAFELVEYGTTERGTAALAQALAERKNKVSCVVVDGKAGSDALCDRLQALKVPKAYIVRPKAANVISASQGLLDMLRSGGAVHSQQAALDTSALTSCARQIGHGGGWAFDGDNSEAIQACALALWGLKNTKRNPRRKQRLL